MTKPLIDRRLLPKRDAARYLFTSPQGLDEMGIKPRVHPRRGLVYDIRDLDAWADALPYEGEKGKTCAADEAFG